MQQMLVAIARRTADTTLRSAGAVAGRAAQWQGPALAADAALVPCLAEQTLREIESFVCF